MTMNFRLIKASVITLLGAAAAGRYRTIGYQLQNQAASEVEDNNRLVQVFFSQGDLPKSKGAISGPTMHDITYRVELTVSKSAVVDVATLKNPASTDGQRATALAAKLEATSEADDSLDELYDHIYQILMDAENYDLGMPTPVANRWVDQLRKDDPLEDGELIVLTGSMMLTCSIDEQVTGDAGQAGDDIEVEIRVNDDTDEGRAGRIVDF